VTPAAAGRGRRPVALTAGAALLAAAALPAPVLAGLALAGQGWRVRVLADGLPAALTALGARPELVAAGVGALAALTLAHLVAVGLAWAGRPAARTATAALAGCGVVALALVLLAASPQPARLAAGGLVLAAALAGVVLCYQPGVDRYLAGAGGYRLRP
jgi:hypothetical protein